MIFPKVNGAKTKAPYHDRICNITKAIKSVPYDADFKALSSVNTATLEVFLLGIQAMQGKKEALDAYKEINKILDNRLKR